MSKEKTKLTQTDKAYEYIKKSIVTKKFFPGNRLLEEALAQDIGVSRSSVRTALLRLRYEGIAEGFHNHGMRVTQLQASDIRDVFEIRQTLEVGAFKLAIDNISPEVIERMRRINGKLREVTENFSISEFVKYNRNFHWEIVKASNNKYYEKYLDEIYNTVSVCLLFYNNTVEDRRSLHLHEEIIMALKSKNFEAGKEAIIKDNICAIEDTRPL